MPDSSQPNSAYRHNHYVPEWYQRRFFLPGEREQKFFYLDLKPDALTAPDGRKFTKKALNRWGAGRCFAEDDLYTTKFGAWESIDIEKMFFGKFDTLGRKGVEYFAHFKHDHIGRDEFRIFLEYLSLQKLRTPKGLGYLASITRETDKNRLLMEMQRLRQIYCATWTECVWSIANASESKTKFIVSDHPVTIYNSDCFPQSKWCVNYADPDIRWVGSHTLFPLSVNKILILTNLAWVRDRYQSATNLRPNPHLFRHAMFKFTDIQVGRKLDEIEVNEINYIIKRRAFRYIAAAREEWLYPERHIPDTGWRKLGNGLLLMPDPRQMALGGEIIIGYDGGRASEAFDEYGRRPGQPGYLDPRRKEREVRTFHRFQGEFARLFGPRHRGMSLLFGRNHEEDSLEYHAAVLEQEIRNGGGPRPKREHRRARGNRP